MTPIFTIADYNSESQNPAEAQNTFTTAIEKGHVLFLPNLGFNLTSEEKRFLSPSFIDTKAKNISFNPKRNVLKGAQGASDDLVAIGQMIERFSIFAQTLVHNIFPHYQQTLKMARTSFRPVQTSCRKTSLKKDDSRLHVDAFPSSPNQGERILRVFSNVNPNGEDRVWRIGEPFIDVAKRFLPTVRKQFPGSASVLNLLGITKTRRTAYDHIMLNLHDNMKQDTEYQANATQIEFRFPPGSTWIVLTDVVSHAAMRGQHLLEQTFHLSVTDMLDANHSPLKILEDLSGRPLI
jgi:hypothetical protein